MLLLFNSIDPWFSVVCCKQQIEEALFSFQGNYPFCPVFSSTGSLLFSPSRYSKLHMPYTFFSHLDFFRGGGACNSESLVARQQIQLSGLVNYVSAVILCKGSSFIKISPERYMALILKNMHFMPLPLLKQRQFFFSFLFPFISVMKFLVLWKLFFSSFTDDHIHNKRIIFLAFDQCVLYPMSNEIFEGKDNIFNIVTNI